MSTFVAAIPLASLIVLTLLLSLLVLNYVAIAKIISKAGYSKLWILVPLTPMALTFACMIAVIHNVEASLQSGTLPAQDLSRLGVLWRVDQVSGVVVWIFFLYFAFAEWPILKARSSANRLDPRQLGVLNLVGGIAAPEMTERSATEIPAGYQAPDRPTPWYHAPDESQTSQIDGDLATAYCPWCGAAVGGRSGFFHDCGLESAAPSFCVQCGSAVSPNQANCVSCGATIK